MIDSDSRRSMFTICTSYALLFRCQGCILSLERLGLETSRDVFLRRLGLESVSGQEQLGLVSVLSLLHLETQRLGKRSHVQYENS